MRKISFAFLLSPTNTKYGKHTTQLACQISHSACKNLARSHFYDSSICKSHSRFCLCSSTVQKLLNFIDALNCYKHYELAHPVYKIQLLQSKKHYKTKNLNIYTKTKPTTRHHAKKWTSRHSSHLITNDVECQHNIWLPSPTYRNISLLLRQHA